jgi:precorrin-4 methylase
MKKRLILSIILPAVYVVLTSSGGNTTPPWQKETVSFPMMNQEIRHTMEENDRQKTMKNRQDINLTTEVVNKKQWEKFKETTTKIQERLRLVDFAMQAIPTGYAIFLESQKIQDIQTKIITEIETAPYSLVVVLPAQIKFVDDMQMVVRLLSGIVISYGAINQMEKAERKLLLEYAL